MTPRIVGMVVVGPGEGDRYLTQCLRGLNPLVDALCIVLNNPDPETERIVMRAELNRPRYVWRDDREWGTSQHLIKNDFLARVVQKTRPDWVIALDADEVLNIDRKTVESLASQPHDVGYYFWCVELWDYPDYYREDFTFDDVRMFRICPDRTMRYKSTPLHCGMAPGYAYHWGTRTPFTFLHYGLMQRKDRERKYERYRKYDPKGVYHPQSWYDALLAKNPSLNLVSQFPMKADGMAFRRNAPAPESKTEAPTVGFAFMTRHGRRIVVADTKTRDFYLSNPRTYTFLGEEPLIDTLGEAPVPDEDVLEILPEAQDSAPDVVPEAEKASEPVQTSEDAPKAKGKPGRKKKTL